ncbi:MAG: proteasome accessory factor PafA2 family protein, partial [Actinomycetes bacterium]
SGLESDPNTLAHQLDWVAKHRLFDAYRDRHGLTWDDARLAAMDLQYHDLRPASSLARRIGLDTLADPAVVEAAITEPPNDTRAYFRGRALARFAPDVVSANWDSVVFDTGAPSLQRVPMMDPTRGTARHLGDLFDRAGTAAELLAELGH